MKTYVPRLIVICMLAPMIAGFAPQEAGAQSGAGESVLLLIKIRNIDLFSRNFEKLMPSTAGSKTPQQMIMLRGMLQDTDWIDPDRSIVAGMFLEDAKADWVVLVPFRIANPTFQKNLGTTSGQDYYLTVFPPRPRYEVSPAVEKSLLDASLTGTEGGLVIQAAVGRLLEMFEPQIAESLAKLEASLPANPEPPAMSPQDTRIFLGDMLKNLKQVDILRFGVGLSGDVLFLQFDIDSRPDTLLASVLTDRGGVAHLTEYPIDMPLRFRSRPHDMAGMMELAQSAFGRLYRLLGIDFDEVSEITKSFTGEMAGGMNLDSSGIAFEMIAVLRPGVKGEGFYSKCLSSVVRTLQPADIRHGGQANGSSTNAAICTHLRQHRFRNQGAWRQNQLQRPDPGR
jgi:hypothetical protein